MLNSFNRGCMYNTWATLKYARFAQASVEQVLSSNFLNTAFLQPVGAAPVR